MVTRAVPPAWRIALCAGALLFAAACGGSSTAPTPVAKTDVFTGTLQPAGTDFKTFVITAQGPTDLSVTVTSLTPLASSTSVAAITIGVGFGTVSGATCALQVSNSQAVLGQELFAPSGATAGTFCVQIFDASTLTEAVSYSMTVKHF
jgi:hypothetical protein